MKNLTFYTVDQVCDLLKISRTTFYDFVQKGKLRPVKIGRMTRVSEQALETFVANMQEAA